MNRRWELSETTRSNLNSQPSQLDSISERLETRLEQPCSMFIPREDDLMFGLLVSRGRELEGTEQR
jgi:hypothetical protein